MQKSQNSRIHAHINFIPIFCLILVNNWPNDIFAYNWTSINYVYKLRGGRGSPKCQRYYISLFSKLVNGGGQNPQNSVNVVYGCPLI